jgi:hypothetical protein
MAKWLGNVSDLGLYLVDAVRVTRKIGNSKTLQQRLAFKELIEAFW